MKLFYSFLLILLHLQPIIAQKQIYYHDFFADNSIGWNILGDTAKAYCEQVDNELYIETSGYGKNLAIAAAPIKLNATGNFIYLINFDSPDIVAIGLSGNKVKIFFEVNLQENLYRLNYTKSGRYKKGKWKKYPFEANRASDYSLKIEHKNDLFSFYLNNEKIIDSSKEKFDIPSVFSYLEIATNGVIEVSHLYLEGEIFPNNQLKYLLGEGIPVKELDKKKVYTIAEALESPDKVFRLTVTENDLMGKEILPEELYTCKNLQEINLQSGNRAKIIEQLKYFPNLQILNLYYADKVPENIGILKNLRAFSAPFATLSIKAGENLCSLNKLKYLNLSTEASFMDVEALKNINRLLQLEYLDLEGNQLLTVPEGIYHLKNLKYLYLSRNELDSLSDEISNLIHLKVLDVYSNQFDKLPASLGSLKELETLELGFSENLKEIPKELTQLKKLKNLSVKGNFSKEQLEKYRKMFSYVPELEISSFNED